jgi:hypothetical protein
LLELRSEWTIVVETGTAAVDFKGRCVKELAFQEVFTLTALVIFD